MKKCISIVMALMISVAFMPELPAFVAHAADDPVAEISDQLSDMSKDAFAYTTESGQMKAQAASYPAKFDLRNVDTNGDGKGDTSYVTPVKFQNPFGTCWGFAATAAAETSILGSGLGAKDGYAAQDDESKGLKELDLSEKHLVYFVATPINDPSNSQNGEGTHAEKGMKVTDIFNSGGAPFYATSLYASGMGPNLESRDKSLIYRGKNGSVIKRLIRSIGKTDNFSYDDQDDWSISESWRFKQSYVLKESYMLPSPAVKDEETKKYSYNAAGTAAIKEQLINKRAVQIAFMADQSQPNQKDATPEFLSENWAHYTYDAGKDASHAVTIVGWDDNYSKTKFIKGHQPPGNGAWLVKNSWGSGERQFPDRGYGDWGIPVDVKGADGKTISVGSGYFWLSYYDKSLCMPEALAFEKSNIGSTYNIDEYDFMPVTNINAADIENYVAMANVFKADECQVLEQVSCLTSYPGTTVESKVYLLADDFKGPTDGKLVDTVKGKYEYGGFHKMKLNKSVNIQKGQRYSVVQTHKTPAGNYCVYANMGISEAAAKVQDESTWQVGIINKNESFLNVDGKWMDLSQKATKKLIFETEDDTLYAIDNFSIKAYSNPAPDLTMRVTGDTELGLLNPELRNGELSLEFAGSADVDLPSQGVKWEVAKPDIISLTQSKDNPNKAAIKAKKLGETYVYVTVDGVGTKVIKVKVLKDLINNAGAEPDTYIYDGKAKKPEVRVYNSLGDMISSKSYTVSYKDNVKCGFPRIYVKVKSTDKTYRGNIETGFKILPAKAVINSLKAGDGKLTINIKDQKKSGVTKYYINYKVKGASKWQTKEVKAGKTSYTLTNLKKGKKYVVKVRAYLFGEVDNMGLDLYGAYSKTKTSAAIKTGITTTGYVKKKSVKVEFKTVDGAKKYRVAYRKAGKKKWTYKWIGAKKAHTYKKLKKNGLYQFKFSGHKKNKGAMVAESIVSYRYLAGMKTPKVKAGNKQMTVSWTPRKGASGYRVLYSLNKDMSKAATKIVSGANKKNVTIKKLKSYETYYVRVCPYKKKSGITYIGVMGKKISTEVR